MFVIIEAVTLGLTTIWFALGALIALLASMLGASLPIQIFLFLLGSGISLYFTRPVVQKILKVGHTRTNVDGLVGQKARVIERVNPVEGKGKVMVAGQVWSAKTLDGCILEEDEEVEILDIQGVKLVVKTLQE
ncbi:NfeD family protein [Irregularibacter muris]|uniref:NfeD family protein n=1 Tax=Irregularibacter muris TaxID=1796619 RepID=A0AAE3KZF1_9FIRM|nr:NfeD family protein [Irregularibacter muris]MCR1899145.1 NfeD family protein [Irregularibacter muris]